MLLKCFVINCLKNPDLSGYEVLFLAFTFKELFYKSDKDSINYALTNFIVRDTKFMN